MWLITTFIAALAASLLWFLLKKKYKLGFLSLMLWGATIMILVDQVLSGNFLENTTSGMITSGFWLGIMMLLPIFFIWVVAILISKFKKA